MKDIQFCFRVTQEVVVHVWAPDREVALHRAARVVMGPRWQHSALLRRLPWARRPVRSAGGFVVEQIPSMGIR